MSNSEAREISPPTFRQILANVRRLLPKSRSKQTANWVLVKKVIGCGSTSAREWCRWMGIDPYGVSVYDEPGLITPRNPTGSRKSTSGG